ncbi:flippase [Pluralibacter gergoviae]|uniref:flippase n=1 Tax=Pluralibacter gergoviae TaxID=61647 RepID=UPI00065081DB|nr:flippase [Pluralibacter gergoviae]KMK08931.1 transporter [Pluralibacter gergoviae]
MSLIKNSIYNLAGFIIPTALAIPALGILSRQLGTESFGIFTLVFALIGYASIFDAGITRAVIREIAIFRDNIEEKKKIISTASSVVLMLAAVASFLLYFFADSVTALLKVSSQYVNQVNESLIIIALIIPIYLLNQVWLAYLEGEEKFGNINIQKTISSTLLAVLPAIFCIYSPHLISAVIGLAIARILSLVITFFIGRKFIVEASVIIHRVTLVRLIHFGGWLAVSNIISPLMVYFDRFVISHVMGAAKVAFYTAPSEGVTRLINIPYALSRALFPKLSNVKTYQEKKNLEKKSYLILTLVCLPIVIVGMIFAKLILTLWLGPEYAGTAALVMQILLIGFYFNSLAQIPYSALQANGYSKTTALIHVFEIIPYLTLLFWLTNKYGVTGTAVAWSVRTMIDFILLFLLSKRKVKIQMPASI